MSNADNKLPPIRVGITGGIRSGKDTVAENIVEVIKLYRTNTTHSIIGFADGITDLIEMFMPNLLEGGKPRKAYQEIGQTIRKFDPDVWVNYTLNTISLTEAVYPDSHIIVKDVRQPNEARALKERGFIIVKVVANEDERVRRARENNDQFDEEDFKHETEKAIDQITPDAIIYNEGSLEELYYTVEDFIQEFYSDY